MDDERTRDTRRLALAVGVVAPASAACLAAYYVVGGPFGTFNDLGNAATGVLSGWLAWRLRRQLPSRVADIAIAAALCGAAITVVGSALVISGTTGFFLAGLVSSVGIAGIGTWLLVLNRSAGEAAALPRKLRTLGVAAGALMALGVVAAPGIFLGLDDAGTAPAWVWISSLSWLGIYVVYPAWAIWMGRLEAHPFTRAKAPAGAA